MATRSEAVEAVARHLGIAGAPRLIFADAGDGRWLALGAHNLAVDRDGTVKAPSELFSAREVDNLRSVFGR
jgi:hypothetical protein